MTPPVSILLAEDDDTDVLFLERAFAEVELRHPLQVARDGKEAIDLLSQAGKPPDDRLPGLVILDLKMPRLTGLEVLDWMRQHPVMRRIPVIVFSSSAHRADIERAYALGANAFLVKPPSTAQRKRVAQFIKDWLHLSLPPLASSEGVFAAKAVHPGE